MGSGFCGSLKLTRRPQGGCDNAVPDDDAVEDDRWKALLSPASVRLSSAPIFPLSARVCVCVCVWEEKQNKASKMTPCFWSASVCVCVCVVFHQCVLGQLPAQQLLSAFVIACIRC